MRTSLNQMKLGRMVHSKILDLILGQSEEHGLTLHTLDEALRSGLDISNLQFNDYFIVRNGELISSMQIPKEISSHDNPLWVSKQDLQEICGINLKQGTQHPLTSRFLLEDRDAILTFERARFPRIPEDAKASRLLKFTTLRRH